MKQTKFKLNKRDGYWFHENSADVNVNYAKEVCDIAILPLGAIEQHGPHCSCGMDYFNAIYIAEAVAKKTDAMLLSCPVYGAHPNHHWGMPGTIPLSFETHIALVVDIIRGAAHAGYNKFIILSAHGQTMTVPAAVHKLGIEGFFVLHSTWYDFLRDNKTILEDFMWHADEAETSVGLSQYPQWINMDLVEDGFATPTISSRWKMAPGQAASPGQFYHFEGTFGLPEADDLANGVIGNPTKATKEKGDKLVDAASDLYAELIAEIAEKYPVGVNPLGFRNPLGYTGVDQLTYDEGFFERRDSLRREAGLIK